MDEWGGVHVLYYVGWYDSSADTPHWKYKVKIAHIPNFRVYEHPTGITTTELTSQPFDLDGTWVQVRDSKRFIGDYMNSIDSRGCQLYAGFIARDSNFSTDDVPAVYVATLLIDNSICSPDANCYVNCDGSTTTPILNVDDFICFQERFAAGESYANCDQSTTAPVLNVNDFICFMTRYSAGCM